MRCEICSDCNSLAFVLFCFWKEVEVMKLKELLAVIADPTRITLFINGEKILEKQAFEIEEHLDREVSLVVPTGHLNVFVHLVEQ